MDIKGVQHKLTNMVKKYRYVLLVLTIGLILMSIPSHDSNREAAPVPTDPEENRTITTEESLAQILSQVDGAGDVRVLLTVVSGEETLYQTDEDVSVDGESSSAQVSTVRISSSDREEHGLVRQINPPVYKGAIIVCQGADDPKIQLAIVDAVSKVTGLGADRISVLKMK